MFKKSTSHSPNIPSNPSKWVIFEAKIESVKLKVYTRVEDFKGVNNPVLTTGTFDGVHSGHRVIIDRLKDIAKRVDGETVLLTFHPHPRMVLFPDDTQLRLLQTIEEKKEKLAEAGIDHLILLPFTHEFSRMTSLEYVRDLLVEGIGIHTAVVGYDHRFGRNREGDFTALEEFGEMFGFHVEEISAQLIENVSISSTKIRNALFTGDVSAANSFLGYNYSLSGRVIQGDGLGRTLGFPTANISIADKHKLIPANGVYTVGVRYGNSTFQGMMNIGYRPTVTDSQEQRIEVHLIDFNADLYDQEVSISVLHRLRDEMKFKTLDELKAQLLIDRELVLRTI